MKKKFKLNSGRQTTLDHFWKSLNSCRGSDDEPRKLSDEEALSTNSPLNDPSCEPELIDSFGLHSLSPHKSPKARKRSSVESEKMDESLFYSFSIWRATSETLLLSELVWDEKTEERAFTGSDNLLDGVPLVAKSPPSDTEASLPITGSTPGGSSSHDFGACTSSSVDLSHELLVLPRIHTITIGDFQLEPPYTSPLPLELVKKGHLYVCEKCLEFKESQETLERHASKCYVDYPPGDEIFRQDDISLFEVDGNIAKGYSQNLCLLAKLFIDHKTLFYDVEPFLFYVLTVWDSTGCHLAGYFSKQKCSVENNLSCILTLPSYQNRGYGRFLIDFSFLLSRREGTTGTPERPLSDMGNLAYRSYWRSIVLEYFKRPSSTSLTVLTLEDIARTTGVSVEDIVQTMKDLEMLHFDQKGEMYFTLTFPMLYKKSFIVNRDLVESHWAKAESDTKRIWIDEDNLKVVQIKVITFKKFGLNGTKSVTH
uniref:histone acetyltransferase n=1 Tax=Setaria digitata TaxID=48799 RepID=A0A915PXW7_9BILA